MLVGYCMKKGEPLGNRASLCVPAFCSLLYLQAVDPALPTLSPPLQTFLSGIFWNLPHHSIHNLDGTVEYCCHVSSKFVVGQKVLIWCVVQCKNVAKVMVWNTEMKKDLECFSALWDDKTLFILFKNRLSASYCLICFFPETHLWGNKSKTKTDLLYFLH